MKMVKSTNINVLNKMPYLKEKILEYFGNRNVSVYAMEESNQLYFVIKCGKEGLLVNDNGETYRFRESVFGGLSRICRGSYYVYPSIEGLDEFGIETRNEVTCENENGIASSLVVLPSSFDDSHFNSRVSFTQVNEKENISCEINFEYMNGVNNKLHNGLLNRIESVEINHDAKKGCYIRPGFVPSRIEYYGKSIIDSDTLNYSFVSFNENGIWNTLKEGSYHLYNGQSYLVRFTKFGFMTPGGTLTELPWPFVDYKKEDNILEYISSLGFETEIPRPLLDAYNNEDKEMTLLKMFLSNVEEYEKDKELRKVLKIG